MFNRTVFIETCSDLCYSQRTVVAVLDQMMNPHWPYLPQQQENYETEEEREAIEGVWNTISDDPLNYHYMMNYHYRMAMRVEDPQRLWLQMDTSR